MVFGFLGSLAVNLLLLVVVGLSGLASAEDEGRVNEKVLPSWNRSGTEKVAILSIEGTILSGEGFFKQQIDHARKDIKDGNLKAIVLRVNSPGGTISGSDYMLHHLRKLVQDSKQANIPIVVSMGGIAASGGYYVSMCVGDTPNTIFAEPTTWTGSIGVIIPHYNLADLMEKWGIQEDAVASHRLKGMGSLTRKMTPEERKILQQLVDDGFTRFKDIVKEGRPAFCERSRRFRQACYRPSLHRRPGAEEWAGRQDRVHRGCRRSGNPVGPAEQRGCESSEVSRGTATFGCPLRPNPAHNPRSI